ncbi:ABC transporter ATP-binding protein [bacterium Unc6]|nr:ABC transporter ATP-binding protein [bacterium Unc6]
MNNIISVRGVKKIYKTGDENLEVLKGITLNIIKADMVCITGPSGSGKSTLLHIMGGLDCPTQGEVFLNNENLYRIGEKQISKIRNSSLGFVFQFYHLLPEFTALENVAMPCVINGEKKEFAFKKAEEVIRYVGLSERRRHRPSELSGGEQQRVAIARAIINNPPVLLCDEPTGNLHADAAQVVWTLLEDLNIRYNTTIIFVTHEDSLAKKAKKIFHLKDGQII